MSVPSHPKIYHFTHVNNLKSILESGCLFSDSEMIARNIVNHNIALTGIKEFRLNKPVPCHSPLTVGDFVPFNFCPRSVMLCKIWYNNDPELTYRGGQQPLVHLCFDLGVVTQYANEQGLNWAFSDANARSAFAKFYKSADSLSSLDWNAIATHSFSDPKTQHNKQAEFLIHREMPLHLLEKIGVHNQQILEQVNELLQNSSYTHLHTSVERGWYF